MITIISLVLVLLTPGVSHAARSFLYPGPDTDTEKTPLELVVYADHITIYGGAPVKGGAPSSLPLQKKQDGSIVGCSLASPPASKCFVFTSSSKASPDIAIRNAWVALLLQARTTRQTVVVTWADTTAEVKLTGCKVVGCILSVSAKSP